MDRTQLENLMATEKINPALIPDLVGLLHNDDLKYAAARVLGKIITQSSDSVQTVKEKLANSDLITQYYLIVAIGYAEANCVDFVPDLIEFLGNTDDRIREIAANTLGEIKDLRSVPHLMKLMCDDVSKNVRYYAMHALCDIKDKATIQQLIALIQQQNTETRLYAIHILGKMGREAKQAIPYIFTYLQDHDEKMVVIAATALGNMGDQRAMGVLQRLSKATSPSFALSAKKALQNLRDYLGRL